MRKTSHAQGQEPILEYVLSWIRTQTVEKYIPKGALVADLGCGYNGKFLVSISEKIKNGVGYDISVAKTVAPKNINLKKANLDNFIGPRKFFDAITALALLEHLERPGNFVKRARGMLKPTGKLIITTPHKRAKPILEFLAFRLGLISKEEIADHKNYFDEDSLKRLMKKSGFKIKKLETFEFGLNTLCIGQKIT